jgi:diaminopimelate decarboxylase
MITNEYIEILEQFQTPFYYYDINLLRKTLSTVDQHSKEFGFTVHYAIKANANPRILSEIAKYGFGADCVSGNEVKMAIDCGFDPQEIVFAGVGKTNPEIELALENKIFCFHCESVQELEVINELAAKRSITASVALRLNPDVKANTHAHITTGLTENKFGLSNEEIAEAKSILPNLKNISLIGLHYHIGSQITDLSVFQKLVQKSSQLEKELFPDSNFQYINFGGGLGIDYNSPKSNPIPDFAGYFAAFKDNLNLNSSRKIHFELGRSIVAQCGSLITRVTFVKGACSHKFAVVDAGMNDLIRPALYGASHSIINLTSNGEVTRYDVVGPVCESADCFAKSINLNLAKRGDLLAILSSGAYGEVMGSRYNLRETTGVVFSDEIKAKLDLMNSQS